MKLHGQCHCGAAEVSFETEIAPEDHVVRTCQCSFCRKHGARTIADPNGRLDVTIGQDDQIARYQFAPATVDFLVCKGCGTYLCAVLNADDVSYSTLNINVMDNRTAFSDVDVPVSYDGETTADRIARRISVWTPTRVNIADG